MAQALGWVPAAPAGQGPSFPALEPAPPPPRRSVRLLGFRAPGWGHLCPLAAESHCLPEQAGGPEPGGHLASSAPSASPTQGPGGPTDVVASSAVWVTWGQLSPSRLSTIGRVVWGDGGGGRGQRSGSCALHLAGPGRPCSLSLGPASLTVCALCPQVMKRVRTEQIQMAVSCYLKRRQYVDSDGPLKPGLRLSQTPEEMAASLAGRRGAPGQQG